MARLVNHTSFMWSTRRKHKNTPLQHHPLQHCELSRGTGWRGKGKVKDGWVETENTLKTKYEPHETSHSWKKTAIKLSKNIGPLKEMKLFFWYLLQLTAAHWSDSGGNSISLHLVFFCWPVRMNLGYVYEMMHRTCRVFQFDLKAQLFKGAVWTGIRPFFNQGSIPTCAECHPLLSQSLLSCHSSAVTKNQKNIFKNSHLLLDNNVGSADL